MGIGGIGSVQGGGGTWIPYIGLGGGGGSARGLKIFWDLLL
jgi:hypothetical protein